MAAGDFSPSVLLNAQAKIQEMWQSPGPWAAEFQKPVVTLETLLARQTARVTPVLVGNKNIGQNVYWMKSGVDSVDYDGASPSLTCDLATGQQLESDSATYTDNRFVVSTVAVNDDDLQKNVFSVEDITAQAMIKAMNDIRKKLNVVAVNLLNSNSQANLDSSVGDIDLGNGAWAENADGITIELPKADARNEDALAEVDAICSNNDLYDFFMVSGRFNWYNSAYNAQFRALNDDQRSIQATYAPFNMVWDLRDMDSALSGSYSFAVNPNAFVIWNRVYSPSNVPMQIDYDKWQYYIEDPGLMIMENGRMRPVRYEVVYQKACGGRHSTTAHSFTHTFEVKYVGGFYAAPAGIDGQTGIMRFKSIAAV